LAILTFLYQQNRLFIAHLMMHLFSLFFK